MIVAEVRPAAVLGEGAETLAHRLPDRLQSLEAISAAAGMRRRIRPSSDRRQ